MTVHVFERIDPTLPLVPLAARRALDWAGAKLSLASWRSLGRDDRAAIARLGAAERVDADAVRVVVSRADPPPGHVTPVDDALLEALPAAVVEALGRARPIDAARWRRLAPLSRFALWHLAKPSRRERIGEAYDELVGAVPAPVPPALTHLSPSGEAHMVDVSAKAPTVRRAVARALVRMRPETARLVVSGQSRKGDVLAAARIAGILAAKRTPELIPLCHGIALSHVAVELRVEAERGVCEVRAIAEAIDRTGVEMEAMTAASVAALTVYDMLKSAERGIRIEAVELCEKSGGRSGHWRRRVEPDGVRSGPLTAIREAALDLSELVADVAHGGAGGVATFLGVVRDHNDGRPVRLLEYHAYLSMAERELADIAAEIERDMPGVRVAATHRLGELAIGEAAVACAASAAHRGEAFAACRELVDRIKARLPIWKREHGPDGPYWVGWEDARCTPGHDHAPERHAPQAHRDHAHAHPADAPDGASDDDA